jgi:hypothetical protein
MHERDPFDAGLLDGKTRAPGGQDLFVVSSGNRQILCYQGRTGEFLQSVGEVDGDFTFGPGGDLFVTRMAIGGQFDPHIQRLDGATFVEKGVFAYCQGGNEGPSTLKFGPDGHLYVKEYVHGCGDVVARYDGTTGAYLGVVSKGFGFGEFTFGPEGDHYVAGRRQDTATGQPRPYATTEWARQEPRSVTFGPEGNLYASVFSPPQIIRFEAETGAYLGVFASAPSLQRPYGIAFGPDDNLYVACHVRSCVFRFDGKTGAYLDRFVRAHSGNLKHPTYLKFGPASHPEP